ncbi:hypothetical protein [Novosphingobium resinovorum]|uniref:hypothetical protein n=1 Tax=Novosphingobium resinovorum TaxID=158500 RepID=UPI002ED498C4|nr:hypothetical protein [Novosphingobium resinovorum]
MADSRGSDQPITRHPLFPAIVALWFGALAGLGSIVVSSSTIEGVVMLLGIDKVIPMAAPPLGTTMRILLALGMTGLGAAIGGVIARRISRGAPALQRRDGIEAEAVEDTGEQPAPVATGTRRRRALAIEPEAAPAAEERAPLPGDVAATIEAAQILNVAEFDIDSFDEAPAEAVFHRPAAFQSAAPEPVAAEDIDESDNLPAWLDAESAWRDPAPGFTSQRGVFTTPPGAQVFQAQLEAAEEAGQKASGAETEVTAPIGSRLFEAYSRELSPRADDSVSVSISGAEPGFKLLPRLPQGDWTAQNDTEAAPSDTQQDEKAEAADDSAVDAPAFAPHVAAAEEVDPAPLAQAAEEAPFEAHGAADRIVRTDLGSLSQVELLERLALAMERRREEARRAAEAVAIVPEAVVAPFAAPVIGHEVAEGFVETQPQEPEAAWPPVSPVAAMPTTLRPVGLDPIGDDHAEPLPGYVPPRHIGLASQADGYGEEAPGFDPHAAIPFPSSPFTADPEAEDEDEDVVLQQGYSSLLNLSRHAAVRKPFLQFGEPDEAGDEIAHATPVVSAEDAADATDEPAPFGRPVLLPDPVGEAPPEPEERPFDAPRNDPEATERALRAALATLQRMSGAA